MNVFDSLRLDGRRALVTGGSRGLGLEMARAMGEAGAELVITSRDAEHLAEAQEALNQMSPAGGNNSG
jgi:NAD(P)-dependent dehydrogenase (short-subunit alcohol dehydrogenase family)